MVKPIRNENRQTSVRRPRFLAKLVYFCIGICITASLSSALWFTYWGVIWPLQGHGTFEDILMAYPQNYIGMPLGFFYAVMLAFMIRDMRNKRADQQKSPFTKTRPETGKMGITISDAMPFLILLLGLFSLLISFLFGSYILAFIGLGLTFWGVLFLYVKTTKYVKLELLNSASASSIINVEKILANANVNSVGIYLPPKRLQDYTSSLVFVPTKPGQVLPTAEATHPDQLELANPAGLLITPPGLGLSKLFEKALKKSFIETSLEDLQTQLPKLFDELQITKHLNIQPQDNGITVTIANHVFEDLCRETAKLELTHKTVGCPLSSALACAFAKATGKPITIEKEETNPDHTTTIQYKILED